VNSRQGFHLSEGFVGTEANFRTFHPTKYSHRKDKKGSGFGKTDVAVFGLRAEAQCSYRSSIVLCAFHRNKLKAGASFFAPQRVTGCWVC
jgi:hypothetical protein